jgi:hypothetical protein
LVCRFHHYCRFYHLLTYLSFFVPTAIKLIYWGRIELEATSRIPASPTCGRCNSCTARTLIDQHTLALTDIYLAISHPLLHRAKMTTQLAAFLILTCSTLTVFLLKIAYIFRLGILRCEVWLVDIKIIIIIIISLFTSCIVLNRLKKTTHDERDPSNGSTVL